MQNLIHEMWSFGMMCKAVFVKERKIYALLLPRVQEAREGFFSANDR